jgi:hypothetical protein
MILLYNETLRAVQISADPIPGWQPLIEGTEMQCRKYAERLKIPEIGKTPDELEKEMQNEYRN